MGMKKQEISEEIINKIKKHYKEVRSSRKTAKKFGIRKSIILFYVKDLIIKKQTNEKLIKQKRVEAVQRRRRKVKQMAVEYKGGKCIFCDYNKCNRALEFHHLDPTKKDFSIGYKGHSLSWERIKKELDKCILVCSNCHAEIHDGLIEV